MVKGRRAGNFDESVAYFENTPSGTASNRFAGPAMRVVTKEGQSQDGVLSVSNEGFGGYIARFGNSNKYVTSIDQQGNVSTDGDIIAGGRVSVGGDLEVGGKLTGVALPRVWSSQGNCLETETNAGCFVFKEPDDPAQNEEVDVVAVPEPGPGVLVVTAFMHFSEIIGWLRIVLSVEGLGDLASTGVSRAGGFESNETGGSLSWTIPVDGVGTTIVTTRMNASSAESVVALVYDHNLTVMWFPE